MLLKQPYIGSKSIIFELISVIPVISVNRRTGFFAYRHAVYDPHTNIILSRLSIPLVFKYVAKILKVG